MMKVIYLKFNILLRIANLIVLIRSILIRRHLERLLAS